MGCTWCWCWSIGGGASRSRPSTKPVVDPSLNVAINCCSYHSRRDTGGGRGPGVIVHPMDNLTVDGCSDLLLTLVLGMNIVLGLETVMDMLMGSLVDVGVSNLLNRLSARRNIGRKLLDVDRATEVQRDLCKQNLSAVASSYPRSGLAHLLIQRCKRTREGLHLIFARTSLAVHAGNLPVRARRANIGVLNCLDRLAEPVAVQLLLWTHGAQISKDIANGQQGRESDNGRRFLHNGR